MVTMFNSNNLAIQSTDEKRIHPLLDLADIVSHEVAHLIDYRIGASDQIDQFMTFETNHSTDSYWDTNKEIYARIANFRQNFGIDPTHTYTEEEVFDLRMRYLDEVIKLQKELDQNPQLGKSIEDIDRFYLRNRSLDYQIFERYTDKEIRDLLNNTASVTPQRDFDQLGEIHAEAYADQPRLAQYPTQSIPQTHQEQELSRQVTHGYRM